VAWQALNRAAGGRQREAQRGGGGEAAKTGKRKRSAGEKWRRSISETAQKQQALKCGI